MTTVAWDGKTLAADSLILVNWMPLKTNKKIWNDHRGWFGIAGDADLAVKIARLSDEQLNAGMPKEWFAESSAIWIRYGQCLYSSGGEWLEIAAPFAIGSGKDFAIAAMDFGKSAEEAVRYAMTRDHGTGGDVVTLTAGKEV